LNNNNNNNNNNNKRIFSKLWLVWFHRAQNRNNWWFVVRKTAVFKSSGYRMEGTNRVAVIVSGRTLQHDAHLAPHWAVVQTSSFQFTHTTS
jgi:hypothetical protein